MRIAVAGGTGTVGCHVVEVARHRGHDVVVLSRATGTDLRTAAGLTRRLDGVDVVIDVSNQMATSARAARRFFETGTRHLLRAGRETGVAHHLALSVVGIDDVDASYFAGKLAQERAVAAGALPWTIARAAQLHEFAGQLLAPQRGPVAVLPRALLRPVAAREVGDHLVGLAEGDPLGRTEDLVGPRAERLADLARRQLAHAGRRRAVVEVRLPGAYGRGLASGSLRGTRSARSGVVTFEQWLAEGAGRATS